MSEHIEQLRQQYPNVNPGFFDLLEERRELQQELSELCGRLSYLLGYHELDGAVPVDKLRAVLDGTAPDPLAEAVTW